MRNPFTKLVLLAVLLLPLAGCGGVSTTTGNGTTVIVNGLPLRLHAKGPVPGPLTIHVVIGRVPHLGVVLVDGWGRTLYAFQPDKRRAVTCTGACTSTWYPFTISSVQALDVSPELDETVLGADLEPGGHRVVTFAGWPLYTYAGDTRPGTANGQGLDSYGGQWYVLSHTGALVTKKP